MRQHAMTPLLFPLSSFMNTTTPPPRSNQSLRILCAGRSDEKKRAPPLIPSVVPPTTTQTCRPPSGRLVPKPPIGYLLPVQRVSRPLDTQEPSNRVVCSSLDLEVVWLALVTAGFLRNLKINPIKIWLLHANPIKKLAYYTRPLLVPTQSI